MFGAQEPLSRRERTALVRILSASARDHSSLVPRQRAALDAYANVLSSPPLVQSDVVAAARAVIKIWADIGAVQRAKVKRRVFSAELLELDDADEEQAPATEMIAARSPLIIAKPVQQPPPAKEIDPFAELAADLLDDIASESATELLEPFTPDWLAKRAPRVHTARFSRP